MFTFADSIMSHFSETPKQYVELLKKFGAIEQIFYKSLILLLDKSPVITNAIANECVDVVRIENRRKRIARKLAKK